MIYTEEPAGFESEMTVAAVYIFFSDKILLLKRLPHKPQGGLFGLPAGKVDAGESVLDALMREVSEETGLTIGSDELESVDTFWVEHDGLQFEYHTYKIKLGSEPCVELRPEEHAGHCWVTLAESLELPLVEDQAFCTKHSFGL